MTVLHQRLGIAATKSFKPEQRALFENPVFAEYYAATGLPPLEELPCGALLGTILVNSSEPITQDDIDDITEEELLYGD